MLHVACATLDLERAVQLLANGADAKARIQSDDEWNGETPLHLLVRYAASSKELPDGFETLTRLLLKHGADVAASSNKGTPLHVAVEAAYPRLFFKDSPQHKYFMSDVADLLMLAQQRFDVNPVDNRGFSHFHFACVRNNVEIVEKFLDHGVDVDQSNDPSAEVDPGFTPLHYAFARGSFDVAKMLIERGAKVALQDRDGNTPLHIGNKNGYVDTQVVDLLLSKGLDINVKNFEGATPLECLVHSAGLTLEKLDFFFNRKSTKGVKSSEESMDIIRSAVNNAPETECEEIFRKLVSTLNMDAAIRTGFTAIHHFVANNAMRTRSSEINGPNDQRLFFKFYRSAIQQFVDMGCDFDQHDAQGKTALHRAAQFDNQCAVELLLKLGADISVMDSEGEYSLTDSMVEEYKEMGEWNFLFDGNKNHIVEHLAHHAEIIRLVGLPVAESFTRTAKMVDWVAVDGNIKAFDADLKEAKAINITEKITVGDFLVERGAVCDYPTMANLQRHIIDQFFKTINHTVKNGYILGILLMQYRKAIARMKLHEPAMIALFSLSSIRLPEFCWELILRDFTYEELKYFVEIADEIHIKS